LSPRVLLVDDDALLRRSLTFNLEQAGYEVMAASNAEDGLSLAARGAPDLVLLDIGLPGMDGLDALPHFRQRFGSPVIFLTARRRELDEVLGLELGADDYITKPFDLDVLLAHIKAVLRRGHPQQVLEPPGPAPISVGDLAIDPVAHTVTVGERPIILPPREFDLLYTLAQQPGRVMAVDDLIARVWGPEYEGESQVVYVHVRWLREKIEQNPNNPQRIITVRGVGYKLTPQGG
jgi:DNA-binding response OmpR family regulator